MAKASIALLAALAAGLSLYLTITSLTDTQPLGCAEGLFTCESVLSTRWSTWLGLPVSAAGMAIYLTLAGVAGISLREAPPRVEVLLRRLLLALVGMVVVSSAWFMVLQFVVLRQFCPYCLAIHACGLLIGLVGLLGSSCSLREVSGSLAVGLIAGAVLVGGQASSLNEPAELERYRMAVDPDLQLERPIAIPWQTEPLEHDSPAYSFLGGQLRIREGSRPIVGDPQARQVAAKLFDYTCGHCRRLHRQLGQLVLRQPGEYGMVLIHVPLSPECNPYKEKESKQHADACQLSRLALAVWLEDPTAFVEFDHWLCAGEESRTADAARQEAVRLIGSEPLELRMESTELEEMLIENVDLYAFEEISLLPTMLTKSRIISGSFSSMEQLEKVLSTESD